MKSDMKMKAKKDMLSMLSKMLGDDMYGQVGDKLKAKKVTVVAPDEKGLEEGLSMAQKIMKKKLGEKYECEEDEQEDEE